MNDPCLLQMVAFIHPFVCLFICCCLSGLFLYNASPFVMHFCCICQFVWIHNDDVAPPPNTLCLFVTLAYIFFSFWVFFDQDDAASPQASPPLLPSLHLLSSAGRGLPLSRQQVAKSALRWTSTVHNNTNSAFQCTVFG